MYIIRVFEIGNRRCFISFYFFLSFFRFLPPGPVRIIVNAISDALVYCIIDLYPPRSDPAQAQCGEGLYTVVIVIIKNIEHYTRTNIINPMDRE